MNTKTQVFTALIGAMMALGSATTANAAIIPLLVDPLENATGRDNFTGVVGGAFTANPSGTAVVNRLGFWDEGADGLAQAHDVGLYEFDGTSGFILRRKATISAGTGSTLDGGVRWESIDSFTLSNTTDTWYMVLASVQSGGGDLWYDLPNSYSASIGGLPALQRFTTSGSIGEVGDTIGVPSPNIEGVYFAGNVGFVPEPGSLALLGFGGLLIARRRRQA